MNTTIIEPEPILYPTRVFVGGLSRETTEMELETFFSNFGTVLDVRIVCDRRTGINKGYGFVTYSVMEMSQNLINKGNVDYKGRSLRLRQAVRKKGGGQYACIEGTKEKVANGNQWMLVPVGGVTVPTQTSPQQHVQYYTTTETYYPPGNPTYYRLAPPTPAPAPTPTYYYVPAAGGSTNIGGTTYY